jgi:hypothetical protein
MSAPTGRRRATAWWGLPRRQRALAAGGAAGLAVFAAGIGAGFLLDDDPAPPGSLTVAGEDVTPEPSPPASLPPPVATPEAPTVDVVEPSASARTSAAAAPAGGLPKAPVPRFECPDGGTAVRSADELSAALRAAGPGAVIRLADGTYSGRFVAAARGTASEPVYLCGGRGAVLQGEGPEGGYVLHLDGAQHWRVAGFTVRNGQKGVMVDGGRGIALQDLLVEQIGDEAVHLRRGSTGNVVRGLTIRTTGLRREKFGEGVYVGTAESNWCEISGCEPDRSDGNFVLDNTIGPTSAEAVDVKEGTTGGVVAGNVFDGSALEGADSWVDVKGNGWLVAGNRGTSSPEDGFQTHVIVDGWGRDNVFRDNVADLRGGSGVGYYLHDDVPNTVACDNRVSGAAEGLSNKDCR